MSMLYGDSRDENTGFGQDEGDFLEDWEKQLATRAAGAQASRGMVDAASGVTRAAQERLRGLEGAQDKGRALATRGAGEAWRTAVGSLGGAMPGGGALAAMAALGGAGSAQRAAFELSAVDRMAEANNALANARVAEAAARGKDAQFQHEMGTDEQYWESEWQAIQGGELQTLLKNYANSPKSLGRALISRAASYSTNHPLRKRWIQAAFDNAPDRSVADALKDMGMPEFNNMTAYGMPVGYEDQEAYEDSQASIVQRLINSIF